MSGASVTKKINLREHRFLILPLREAPFFIKYVQIKILKSKIRVK